MTTAWTWHGGGLEAARRHFGGTDWLDLSTGINPRPWNAAAITPDWQRLPEPEGLAALEAVAARYFGADPRHVCAVPGTELGLRLVGSLIGGEAVHVAPAYRTHGEMIPGARAIDVEAISAQRGTLILANPNNPDGRVIDPSFLLTPRDGWTLVDEAFADCDPVRSIAAHVGEGRKLVVFRSFGKFFGLAGVRLGFVLGPAAILDPLRAILGAWPLCSAAIAMGTAAYGDEAWIGATRLRLRADAEAFDALLARLGYRASGSCTLFRLIETDHAGALFERLAHQSILTRPFRDQPRWLRLGLPSDDAAMARLEAALRG